jgi:decaprenyl-phosphate phosphoribosyltransferase
VTITTTPAGRRIGPLLTAARPRQWTKNLLVFAAPAAAGALADPAVIGRTLLAFVAFCLAASGTYYLNDAQDVEGDRLHPRKRHRPIAAGLITLRTAYMIAAGLLTVSLAVTVPVGSVALTATLAVYVGLTVAYSIRLKRIAIVDIMVVAGGFILRAAAGGSAAGVPLSEWFLIVASFGALFIVAGKRHAEIVTMGEDSGAHRAVLDAYPPDFTRHVVGVSAAIAMVAYCLWAFEAPPGPGSTWLTLSIVPYVGVLLRYALLIFDGHGGEPEEIVLSDRAIQVAAVAWLALVGLGIAGTSVG